MAEDFETLRTSRPGLYYTVLAIGVMCLALALNLLLTTPTFNPYGIDKNAIGIIFGTLGAINLVCVMIRDAQKLRYGLTASLAFMMFWGVSNMQQSFAGKASFQLPILYIFIALMHMPLMVELRWLERK